MTREQFNRWAVEEARTLYRGGTYEEELVTMARWGFHQGVEAVLGLLRSSELYIAHPPGFTLHAHLADWIEKRLPEREYLRKKLASRDAEIARLTEELSYLPGNKQELYREGYEALKLECAALREALIALA